jgi:hypothetical protein
METDLRTASSERQPAEALRLLVATTPLPVRRLTEALEALLDRGAELVFSVRPEQLPDEIRQHPRAVTTHLSVARVGPPADAVAVLRAVADLVRFLGADERRRGRWPRRRALRRLLKLAGLESSRELREATDTGIPDEVVNELMQVLREVERLVPAEQSLRDEVAALGVDGVLILSRCALGGLEPDVIKAARALELPSIVLVVSWDNLSSKAILNEHPDLLLVWNEVQAAEAVEQHGFPPDRVVALGASNFDSFFQEVRNARRPLPRREADSSKTILYLGSSTKVAPWESRIAEGWLRAIRASRDPVVADAQVILRPHPATAARWAGWSPPDARVRLLEPGARLEPAKLAQLLHQADAVVALNTSAELEAAICGRPVLTFRAGSAARGQEGSRHFPHLLEANGGFVLDAATLEEHVAMLGQVLRGDYDPEPVHRFVERFVRPAGIEEPVAPMVAAAISEFVSRGKGRDVARRDLDASAAREQIANPAA